MDKIRIRGAREHNLKDVSIDIPRDTFTVFTGVSGSGKSSLAYDIIYKEGQRRFVESLSPYARQFLGQMDKPHVDHVEGLSPALSIDQKRRGRSSRSTVGTITEIYDHLRLLFSRLGEPHCPKCGSLISSFTPDQIARLILGQSEESLAVVMAPVVMERKGEYRKLLNSLKEEGFIRARIDGNILRLDEGEIQLGRYEKHTIEVVIDRVKLCQKDKSRLREAIEEAIRISEGLVSLLIDEDYKLFSTHRACPSCGISIPEIEPRLFSFNNPEGACPDCRGLGYLEEFEPCLIIPDASLSINKGAIAPINTDGNILFSRFGMKDFDRLASQFEVSLDTPWQDLPQQFRDLLLYGDKDNGLKKGIFFPGIIPVMESIYFKWNLHQFRRYLNVLQCKSCGGARLRAESLNVFFRDKNIAHLAAMTIREIEDFFKTVSLNEKESIIGRQILKEIKSRLEFLTGVGLDYLTLDRRANTLAGGEAQRIRLARELGSGLQGVLYVLDEPSIGLHHRDNMRLLSALANLRDQGNTVLVIEHDEETIRSADHVVDLGPGAGKNGGELVVEGLPSTVSRKATSITGRYLSGKESIPLPSKRRTPDTRFLKVIGAEEHNLKKIDVAFPLGLFIVVTGVSGSGKSTLVDEILKKALSRHFTDNKAHPGKHERIEGIEFIDKVIEVDQSPIGRTPRSNPATYTKVFDEIRSLFASLTLSKTRGYAPGRFSFNVVGGRCEDCKGGGVKEVEMQFLSNVFITCESCNGKRFNQETLEVKYKEHDISQVLDMTVEEALTFFGSIPKIKHTIETLHDVGLGYLQLGQPSPQLSGGEAQRIKLARELRRPATGKTLYILDEPTTGLHFADIKMLLQALDRLVEKGNTVIVIEHNLDVIKTADYIIDLGPEGGEGGGEVVAAGTIEDVMKNSNSYTGYAISEYLDGARRKGPRRKTRQSSTEKENFLMVRGASKNNLKNIDVEIPKNKLVVITGPSGSGKTSLAFETIFAEGQRRFIESLSTYARRFLGRLERGDVDSIYGLAPAIAIDQKSASRNPRSTVATLTEVYDYLRILYARVGIPHCPKCRKELISDTPTSASQSLIEKNPGMGSILAPLWLAKHYDPLYIKDPKDIQKVASELKDQGFLRILIGEEEKRLDEIIKAEDITQSTVYLIVDRIKPNKGNGSRMAEAMETAFRIGNGTACFKPKDGKILTFTTLPACIECSYIQREELNPRVFSFNSHWGACTTCDGLGERLEGVPCIACKGERLKPQYLAVTVGGISISELCKKKVTQALDFIEKLDLDPTRTIIAKEIRKEIIHRLHFLTSVGLDYLSLDRRGDTLAGGEAQRIRLATQIGNRLVGVLYVLDEPTIGLHPRDTSLLIKTLRDLVDLGNTAIVVEHDPISIRSADFILDLGPGAGENGGEVVAKGTLDDILHNPASLTGKYLRGEAMIDIPQIRRKGKPEMLLIKGAQKHNLKNISTGFKLGCLNVVTGVSGSGKSTLVVEVLQKAISKLGKGRGIIKGSKNQGFEEISGIEEIKEVSSIDQRPISKSPHTTPATFTGLMNKIRNFFSMLPGAKQRGFSAARFSYNRPGGRCEKCEGRGVIRIQMHFLSDVWITCEACQGRRYMEETLEVRYQGKNIAQILDMTVTEAKELFMNHKAILKILNILDQVGLGYIRLGQSADTLSGGEAQRIKLAAELSSRGEGNTLYILDEPTTGLHMDDVNKLLRVLHSLVDKGNTVIVVEHNLDVIKHADWIIDLGPEGGDKGGEVVAFGTPEEVAKNTESHTARFLRDLLQAENVFTQTQKLVQTA